MIYCVGVGPGDPELMTLKAVRIIPVAAFHDEFTVYCFQLWSHSFEKYLFLSVRTSRQMIVHDTDRLKERVCDHRADKADTAFFHIPAHCCGHI